MDHPTPAEQWRTPILETVSLPSGNAATLRVPSVWALFADGSLPRIVGDVDAPTAPTAPLNPMQLRTLADTVVEAAFVSPEVVRQDPDPNRNQIALGQVAPEDRAFVLQWALRKLGLTRKGNPAARVASKSDRQPVGGVSAARDGTDLRHTP
jgi:hypothetical protein